MLPLLFLVLSLWTLLGFSRPARRSDPSFNAPINYGTFEDPSVLVRPKFRYWIPDASVDPAVVASDVKSAGQVGMGGMELLGYYLYGGPPSNGAGRGLAAPVDWATYGFGTPAWQNTLRAFAQATKDNGLIMDFAVGPNQGTGVPAIENSDGLMWDIAAFNASVPLKGSFNGVLPGWGTGKLIAAVTGVPTKSQNITEYNELLPDPGSLPGDLSLNRTQVTLSAASLGDVTKQVSDSGHLSIDFLDFTGSGLNHTIFAVYLIHSDYRAQDGPLDLGGPQTAPKSWVQNGSWSVDHFSSLGAQTTASFWEQHILTDGLKELVMDVGNYAWEDSVEIDANVYWTQNYTSFFEEDHGYSINKYLPILFHRNGHAAQSNPSTWWVTDEPDLGNNHIADYRATLTNQARKYLTGLNEWAESYLNKGFSAQIGYNLDVDMLALSDSVDAPECESLDFSDLIDGYRQYSGPANLAQRRVVSSECGAVKGEAYVQTLPELVWKTKRSWAGGINQFVFHGYPYSGQYGNTTWPVFTTFNYQYSSMHGPHEPAWDFYEDHMNFVARNNWVFQQGAPKLDVAFWQKVTVYPGHVYFPTYAPTDLLEMGYQYDYLSPDNFNLPAARVVDKILAPDAQAFKAMVVRANDSLTVEGVNKLVDFAHAGLPIVLAGGMPSNYIGTYGEAVLQRTKASLAATTSLPNVHVTDSYYVAPVLSEIGIAPRTKVATNGTLWYTHWRAVPENATDYVLVYNDAVDLPQGQGMSEGTVEFDSTATPYEYNAWTGEQLPILSYRRTNNSTIIPLRLAGNQSTIIAFKSGDACEGQKHVSDVSSSVVSLFGNEKGTLTAKVRTLPPGPSYMDTSGRTHQLKTTSAAPLSLTDWTLVVEHWDPPANLYNITAGATRYNTTHQIEQLVSWQEITGLQNVSGRGYYSTKFTWPPASCRDPCGSSGAIIDFGYVYHTLRATLNGHALPPFDVTAPTADLGSLLIHGQNTLEAVVTTPLGNVLRPIWDQLMSSGESPGSPDAGPKGGFIPPPIGDYGLKEEVTLIPYAEIEI